MDGHCTKITWNDHSGAMTHNLAITTKFEKGISKRPKHRTHTLTPSINAVERQYYLSVCATRCLWLLKSNFKTWNTALQQWYVFTLQLHHFLVEETTFLINNKKKETVTWIINFWSLVHNHFFEPLFTCIGLWLFYSIKIQTKTIELFKINVHKLSSIQTIQHSFALNHFCCISFWCSCRTRRPLLVNVLLTGISLICLYKLYQKMFMK